MKKMIFRTIFGLSLFVGVICLMPQESEAIIYEYKAELKVGSDGCLYMHCLNTSGEDCSSPGSMFGGCENNDN